MADTAAETPFGQVEAPEASAQVEAREARSTDEIESRPLKQTAEPEQLVRALPSRSVVAPPGSGRCWKCSRRHLEITDVENGYQVFVPGKKDAKLLCRRSLFTLSIHNPLRQQVLLIVESKWFDSFILVAIFINSIFLMIYHKRRDASWGLNSFIDNTAELVFLAIFTTESVLKIIAWGLIKGRTTYLRDPWNVLDFVVVVSGLLDKFGVGGSMSFLRLFRLLRPLRSLNSIPEMKDLVNSAFGSVLKLSNVIMLAIFLFVVFGIVGISLMRGIFYRQCYTGNPQLVGGCWSWNASGDGRLCGGNYMCEDTGGICGGLETDADNLDGVNFRPDFGGRIGPRDGGAPWCEPPLGPGKDGPQKLFWETWFVHFDHLGGALLLIFQTMTLEGWTELMYMVEDAFSPWAAILYFTMTMGLTSIFMLNVFLAVVDTVSDETREKAEKNREEERRRKGETMQQQARGKLSDNSDAPMEQEGSILSTLMKSGDTDGDKNSEDADDELLGDFEFDDTLWADNAAVRLCHSIATNPSFGNFILLIITGNVINMCLSWFSLQDPFGYRDLDDIISILEKVFLCIFILEMFIMIGALGPRGYLKNKSCLFDGFVVSLSITEVIVDIASGGGGGGALSALRTFRLFRVINKLASKWAKLKVLLKAMIATAKALRYWVVLFCLILYIFTLMWMDIFAKEFHFNDPDSADQVIGPDEGENWCQENDGTDFPARNREDCIPRAHFDTFVWGFVTVFQVMTGENWNTIMYAGMRASTSWDRRTTLIPPTLISALLFVMMIFVGQLLVLNLFLSMLMSEYQRVQDNFEQEEQQIQELKREITFRKNLALAPEAGKSSRVLDAFKRVTTAVATSSRNTETWRPQSLRKVAPDPEPPPALPEPAPVAPSFVKPAAAPGKVEKEELLQVHPPASSQMSTACSSNPSSGAPSRRPGTSDRPSVIGIAGSAGGSVGDSGEAGSTSASATSQARRSAGGEEEDSSGNVLRLTEAEAATAIADHELLPGQLPTEHSTPAEVAASPASKNNLAKHLDEDERTNTSSPELPADRVDKKAQAKKTETRWPHGYSLFIFSEANVLRKGARWLLHKEIEVADTRVKCFDNFIMVCILLSTFCMMCETPLSDPAATFTKAIRACDRVFAMIFCIEMGVKLVAGGLFWGSAAYIKNTWNWLDGIVVIVSIIDFATQGGGPGFLRVLRILRAFRPLRMIARNEGLKLVIQTMIKTLPDLFGLVIVFFLFTLIFALICLMYLKGAFYSCSPPDDTVVQYQSDMGVDFVTPMCLGTAVSRTDPVVLQPSGSLSNVTNEWVNEPCPSSFPTQWERASEDTPICVGRCDPGRESHPAEIEHLCHRKYLNVRELPSACDDDLQSRVQYPEEVNGVQYVEDMQRSILMPCGGWTTQDVTTGAATGTGSSVSCQATFCPNGHITDRQTCEHECKGHKYFCKDSCKNGRDLNSDKCRTCRKECEAACTCEDFCTPLIKDAALCQEQGGEWGPSLSQNFDNIGNAVLTLFEISTTEGWVDVMYAACDTQGLYIQPIRDASWPWVIFFVAWILLSFMFLINLVVGVIVETFFDLKANQIQDKHEHDVNDRVRLNEDLDLVDVMPDEPCIIKKGCEGKVKEIGEEGDALIDFAHFGTHWVGQHHFVKMVNLDKKELTQAQKTWVEARLRLHTRASKQLLFDLKDLHLLPVMRRKVYNLISSKRFDHFIMTAILLNTLVMAVTIFPEPVDHWEEAQTLVNYCLSAIYLLEAILKLYALRRNYFLDNWNRFDFFCVSVSIIGIVLKLPPFNVDLGAITGVLRVLRLARLLRFTGSSVLKELNRLFMCLLISIPKLVNVTVILFLFLILFSILGMSLFGTHKFAADGTLNEHGNFQTFWRSFFTLVRAATGEAWNEIMHDLQLTEADHLRGGDWCTPRSLFETRDEAVFNILQDKCLVPPSGQPNACTDPSMKLFSPAYWAAYTILIGWMVLNLVVAVILQGYEEGQENEDKENIDKCIEIWKLYDTERKMKIPLDDALKYINHVVQELKGEPTEPESKPSPKGGAGNANAGTEDEGESRPRIAFSMRMKFARAVTMTISTDQQVTFLSATRQILRLVALKEVSDEALREIDGSDLLLSKKEYAKLQKLENKTFTEITGESLVKIVAAMKIQRGFRLAQARKERAKIRKNRLDGNSSNPSGSACPSPELVSEGRGPTSPVPEAIPEPPSGQPYPEPPRSAQTDGTIR